MKWKLLRHIFCICCIFLSFFVLSCIGSKRTKTITVTETVIKFDTIIHLQHDTILKLDYVRFTDTAIIDTPVSVARSYYSTTKQKIVLELQNKNISVPVSIYKKVTQNENKKEVVKDENRNKLEKILKYIVYLFFIVIILYIYFKPK